MSKGEAALQSLAARLEQGGSCLITQEEEALRTKCVRFAADMARLTQQVVEQFEVMPGGEVMEVAGDSIRLQKIGKVVFADHWHNEFRTSSEGSDIYAAARKVVEALDEGKCDGN